MKKVFFSDLDGTLLTTEKNISPKTREALDVWLSKGNYLVISSGRPLPSVKEVMEKNGLIGPNIYGIAFNGGQIYNSVTKEIVMSKTLTMDEVQTVALMAKERNIYCHTYDSTYIITPKIGKETEFYTRTIHLPLKELPDFPIGITERPCKFLCVDPDLEHDLDAFGNDIMKKLPNITCVKSNQFLLEVFPSSSGKGAAIHEFCELMNIDIKNTFAAGDELNDMSMLQEAGCGIAMINANPDLKPYANRITENDNDHDGLVAILLEEA